MFLLQMAFTLAFSLGWRLLYYSLGLQRSHPKRVLFIGVDSAGRARKVLTRYLPEAEIVGYLGEEGADESVTGPCLGVPRDALRITGEYRINRVVILESELDPQLARDLFNAKLQGLPVDDIRSLYERVARRIPVDLISEDWLLMEDGFNLNVHAYMRRAKRAFDIAFALGLGAVALPVLLLTALAVRLESPGPVIYRQKRVGLHEKEFTVYKIRSMRADAEKDGAAWAVENDPRVTRVGSFIRKMRIDELPQLWNVLVGDMSVVGPRPERREFVRELAARIPFFYVRHTVKPGVTGWAQVSYPYGSSVEDARFKLEYDLYYIKHMSALLEAKVLLKTIGVVLFPRGAR
jgi:sugar transferase (PEP-CTERM system associated)